MASLEAESDAQIAPGDSVVGFGPPQCDGCDAEFERELIKERQREGMTLAKKRGVYRGRKRSLTAAEAAELLRRVGAGESKTKLAKELGVTRNTIYMYLGRGGK